MSRRQGYRYAQLPAIADQRQAFRHISRQHYLHRRRPYLPSRGVTRADRGAGNNAGTTAVTRAVAFMKS